MRADISEVREQFCCGKGTVTFLLPQYHKHGKMHTTLMVCHSHRLAEKPYLNLIYAREEKNKLRRENIKSRAEKIKQRSRAILFPIKINFNPD